MNSLHARHVLPALAAEESQQPLPWRHRRTTPQSHSQNIPAFPRPGLRSASEDQILENDSQPCEKRQQAMQPALLTRIQRMEFVSERSKRTATHHQKRIAARNTDANECWPPQLLSQAFPHCSHGKLARDLKAGRTMGNNALSGESDPLSPLTQNRNMGIYCLGPTSESDHKMVLLAFQHAPYDFYIAA